MEKMTDIIGTDAVDVLSGTATAEQINSGDGNDIVAAGAGDDLVLAGAGADQVSGDDGNDTIFGDSGQVFVTGAIEIQETGPITVTFNFEEAGYRNTFGAYKVDPETGTFTDVQVVWENASLQGSGGNLVGNVSSATIDVSAGDKLAFFIISDGYSLNNFAALGDGHYEFRNGDGSPATLDSSNPPPR